METVQTFTGQVDEEEGARKEEEEAAPSARFSQRRPSPSTERD